jgi:bacterioferritin (cytochrome b1)
MATAHIRGEAASGRVTPAAIGWLQRALRHEFAASRQFTLQAVVARRLGDAALALECEAAAAEELRHAQRFAAELAAALAPPGDCAGVNLPIGRSITELLENGRATEAQAVRLYRDAARACTGLAGTQRLFEEIGAEEAQHLDALSQRLRR